ncbi:MAG: ammonium transporter [Pseudomonadota bacterium]
MMIRAAMIALASMGLFIVPVAAFAQDVARDGAAVAADTAWVMTATALVLMMTMPGLALFYGGLAQRRNVLSMLMQCLAVGCAASVLWLIGVYDLAFGAGNGWIGSLAEPFWSRARQARDGLPEVVFMTFQMTFAMITPALIIGAFAERMKFGAVVLWSCLWLVAVYAPVAHWIWGGGWLAQRGVIDFAGGLVVHATAGASGLVIAIMLGPRHEFPSKPPHNPAMTFIGAAMLWVGWYGFNGGSALAADGSAGMAILVTHISASTAALVWMAIERIRFGKSSLVGGVTGLIAGLACITPASGSVGPLGALILGLVAGVVCFIAVVLIKIRWRIDDSFDVFAVHGVGGIIGTLLVAVLMSSALGGVGYGPAGFGSQVSIQVLGIVVVCVYSVVVSYSLAKITAMVMGGLRVSDTDQLEGLDITAHGERMNDT